MKILNCLLLFFCFLISLPTTFSQTTYPTEEIASFWKNNDVENTLKGYEAYLQSINFKKQPKEYLDALAQKMDIELLVGDVERLKKDYQELNQFSQDIQKKGDSATFQYLQFYKAKYLHWLGKYEEANQLLEQQGSNLLLQTSLYILNKSHLEKTNFQNYFNSNYKNNFEKQSEILKNISKIALLQGQLNIAETSIRRALELEYDNNIERTEIALQAATLLVVNRDGDSLSSILPQLEQTILQYAPQSTLAIQWQNTAIAYYFFTKKLKEANQQSDSTWLLTQQKLGRLHPLTQLQATIRVGVLLDSRQTTDAHALLQQQITQTQQEFSDSYFHLIKLYEYLSAYNFYEAYYRQVIEIGEKGLIISQASFVSTKNIHKIVGVAYMKLKNYSKSILHLNHTLKLIEETLGEKHIEKGEIYYLIASVYREQGNYQEAIEYAQKAIYVYQNEPAKLNPLLLARAEETLFSAYFELEDAQNALLHAKNAQYILEKAFLKKYPYLLTEKYNSVGLAFRLGNQYDSATYYYHLAIESENKLPSERRSKSTLGTIHNNLGYAYEQQNNYDSAIVYYQKALSFKEDNWKKANALNNIANTLLKQNKKSEAKLMYEKSLEKNKLGNEYADLEIALDSYKGLVQIETYSVTERINFYKKADELLTQMRSELRTEKDQLRVAARANEIYGNALTFCLAQNNTPDLNQTIFFFAERNRAYLLKRQLQEAILFGQIPDSLQQKEMQLATQLDMYQRLIWEEENQKNSKSTKIEYYNAELVEIRRQYNELKAFLQENFKFYDELNKNSGITSLQKLQSHLKADEKMIIYQWFEPNLFVQVVGQQQVKNYVIQPKEFEKLLTSYRNCLAKNCDAKEFEMQSSELYQILIKQIEVDLTDVKKIVIIPDAMLQQIPFTPLVKFDNQKVTFPLLSYAISFHYSATLWENSKSKKLPTFEYDFVGFAPVFSNLKNEANSTVRNALSALPNSRTEVEQIQSLFHEQDLKAKIYLQYEANQKNLISYATKTRRLHLATHSQTYTKTPFRSHIWLLSAQGAEQLYASDLHGQQIPADLVVLSSCRSGVGQVAEGEGVIALTRSFLYAGSKNIVVSLWQIDDLATKELMLSFYKFVLEGATYAEALQAAKKELASSPTFSSPYYWSSMLLIGE